MVCPTSKASFSFQDCQECRRTDGTTFWFTPLVSDAAAKHLMETLPNPRFDDPDPQATLLKKARQRLVTKIKADGVGGTSAVIKIFPLRNPISRLRHRKYAYTEFINYSKAQARGIPTPKVYAFLENRKFGIVNGSGVLIEFLEGYKNILEMSQDPDIDYQQAASAAIPAICAMYETGAFNADGRDENIYIANNGTSPEQFSIIDWQYAGFSVPRSDWLLEHLVAYFIRKSPEQDQGGLRNVWTEKVRQAANYPASADEFQSRIDRLLKHPPSTKQRIAITPLE